MIMTQELQADRIERKRETALFSSKSAQYALYAICFGFFLVLLDTTALNVAVAAIQREFGGSITGLQWVVNSYTLVFASLLLTCGAVGDLLGVRRLYQIGLALFTITSILCALSPGVDFLIGARILQGLGAAIMLPASLSLLSHAFPHPEERARAVAFWAAVVSLGFAAGPFLGGVLTHAFGWRSIFWMNGPVGLVALLMVRAFVKETKVTNPRRIDWLGQALASLALFSLTSALIEAGRLGWTAPPILAALGISVALAILFMVAERRSSTPVLPGELFSHATFSTCVAIGAILNFGMYGTLFIESIYLQDVRHLNALVTGLMILPFTALPTVTTRLIVNYSGRRHIKTRLIIGHVIATLGALVLALSLRDPGYRDILLGFALLGVAMGCIMPAMTAGVLAAAPTEASGTASGILNSSRQVGGTLGVALMGTLVQQQRERGVLISCVIMFVCYAAMTVITARTIKDQTYLHL